MKRREFVNISFMAGSGLVIGLAPVACAKNIPPEKIEDYGLHPFLKIATDGSITIYAPVPELGQGVRTSLPMILAEELDANWKDIKVEQAEAADHFGNMAAAGSMSVARYYDGLRTIGAKAKIMLMMAAANKWGIDWRECHATNGVVLDINGREKLTYGELAKDAAGLPVPEEASLKDEKDFRIIGQSKKAVDIEKMVRGTAAYGIDTVVEGMKYVSIERCPVRGGSVLSYDDREALAFPGVEKVIQIDAMAPIPYAEVMAGVAVIASNTWAAIQGRKLLEIEWDLGSGRGENTKMYHQRFEKIKNGSPEFELRSEGNVREAIKNSDRSFEFEYKIPFWAHYCMEPMNFTAHFDEKKCHLSGPNQRPQLIQDLISQVYEVPREKVTVDSTLAGGGFGRRLAVDYALEAMEVSKRAGVPVQVLWTREDDVLHDYLRSISFHRLRVAVQKNRISGWFHHLWTKPVGDGPRYEVQGAADIPLEIPNIQIGYSKFPSNIQIGSWRSVSHTYNSFALNNTITEVAHELGEDPFSFYMEMLGRDREITVELPLRGYRGTVVCDIGRLKNVLKKAADLSGWSSHQIGDSALGIACAFYKTTYAGHVAEVGRVDGRLVLKKIVSVMDCGRVINPSGAKAQMEGAVSDAITVALKSGISIKDGRPQEINFDRYPVARMSDMPEIVTHLIPSSLPPSGTGEAPFPAIAPAISNAILRLTGQRTRELPMAM